MSVNRVSVEQFRGGEIVTLNRAYHDVTTETPLIVLQHNAKTVSCARLGGVGNGLRASPGLLVRRDLGWLQQVLHA